MYNTCKLDFVILGYLISKQRTTNILSTNFNDLDANFYHQLNTEKKINSYLKKLKELNWEVSMETNQPNS